jgi:hypothetical protein
MSAVCSALTCCAQIRYPAVNCLPPRSSRSLSDDGFPQSRAAWIDRRGYTSVLSMLRVLKEAESSAIGIQSEMPTP